MTQKLTYVDQLQQFKNAVLQIGAMKNLPL